MTERKSDEQIAAEIIRDNLGYLSQGTTQCRNAIVSALADRTEECAKIAEQHNDVHFNGGDYKKPSPVH